MILAALCGGLCSFGLYRVLQVALPLPSGKTAQALRWPMDRCPFAERVEDSLLPLARLLARLFPMSSYRKQRLEADFSRLRMKQSPQDYVSSALAKSLLLALLGLAFIPIGAPWLSFLMALAALLAYFQLMQTIRKRMDAQIREIEGELPRLVETLGYTLQDNRDLLAFFQKYRHVAGKALAPELDRLIVDMQTGNQEEALQRIDARLGLPTFSALCAILCGVHQGVDQRLSLLVLEQDMRAKERELLRRSMEKRPGRIKAASFLLTILLIFLFMIPLALLIIHSLQAVGF